MEESESTSDSIYDNDDIIDDPAKLRAMAGNEGVFSHENLVAMAYHKCINSCAQEMRKGFWKNAADKNGKETLTYFPDTRQEFIQCVDTLRIVMSSDVDDSAKTIIKNIATELGTKKKELINAEDTWWNALPYVQRMKVPHIKGHFNTDLPYYHAFINDTLEKYKDMFAELEMVLKRTKYFRKSLNVA